MKSFPSKLHRLRGVMCAPMLSIAMFCALNGNAHSQIYVSTYAGASLGEYNATTGGAINASLVSGVGKLTGIALSGNNLYLAQPDTNTLGEYNATTGATINATLLSGLQIWGIALSGNNLYVAEPNANVIGEYNATTGATINASLVSLGGGQLTGLALSGNNLYVANAGSIKTVGEYDATTGDAINATLLSGVNGPEFIAVVPEPSTFAMLVGGFGSLLAFRRRR